MGNDLCNSNNTDPGFNLQPTIRLNPNEGNNNNQNLRTTLILTPLSGLSLTTKSSRDISLISSNSHLNSSAFILGCKSDQNLRYLNKYMLLFLYFIKTKQVNINISSQIDDFLQVLKTIDQNQQCKNQIELFEKEYKSKTNAEQRQNFLINQFFKNGIFSSAIEQFPTISQDSRIFGYIRRPFVDLYKGIRQKYQQQISYKGKYIYCVVQIKPSQYTVLNKIASENRQNYFAFSTFVRGFTDEDNAIKRRKKFLEQGRNLETTYSRPNHTIFFTIMIPRQTSDVDYDFGFYVEQSQQDNELGNVIINIRNHFKITSFETDENQYNLEYNGLARLIHQRRERDLQIEPGLLSINDIILAKSQQISSQSSLIRIIGERQDSVAVSQTNLQNLRNSLPADTITEKINLIDYHLSKGQYSLALEYCQSARALRNLPIIVKQAQIHYQQRNYEKVDVILTSLQCDKIQLKAIHFEQYALCELISAKRLIANSKKNQAISKLKILKDEMIRKYKALYEYKGRHIERLLKQLQHQLNGSNKNISNSNIDWEAFSIGLNDDLTLSH